MGFCLYTVFRFRKSKHPKADYVGVKTHFSTYLEGAVAVIEIGLLAGLSIPLWAKKVAPPPPDALRVRVFAQQFRWNVLYPGPDGKFGRTDVELINDSEQNYIGIDRKR